MSLLSPAHTLRYHLSRPLFSPRDLSWLDTPTAGTVCAGLHSKLSKDRAPQHAALEFYLLNHVMGVIRNRYGMDEELPPEVVGLVNLYATLASRDATRLYAYLLAICTREMRHEHGNSSMWQKCSEQYGAATAQFLQTGSGEGGILKNLFHNAPDVPLGHYTQALTLGFNHGSFSGGFGGKAWGNVAQVLEDYVKGEISAEVMMDLGWALCHNNGPIFNKGMLYTMYDSTLNMILDVQRAGFIPQYVGTEDKGQHGSSAFGYWQQAVAILGDELTGYVDWYAVADTGIHGNYSSQKKALESKLQNDPEAKEKLAEKAKAAILAKEEYEKTHLEIYPGVTIKKFEREAEVV